MVPDTGGGTLPQTGAETGYVWIAVALLAVGLVLVVTGRVAQEMLRS